jgi:hypothetical protein
MLSLGPLIYRVGTMALDFHECGSVGSGMISRSQELCPSPSAVSSPFVHRGYQSLSRRLT